MKARQLPHLTLVDLQPALVEEFQKAFAEWSTGWHVHRHRDEPPPVTILEGDWRLALPTDCVVSPANSFGLMDGGFDLVLTEYFGPQLQVEVRRRIRELFAGEQHVGTSIIVETGREECPYVAHTPTMRMPSNLQGTPNAYYAMKAMLLETMRHPHIDRVVCTGLGTFYGNLDPATAAAQMAWAYHHIEAVLTMPALLQADAPNEDLWPQALAMHQHLAELAAGQQHAGASRDVPAST